MRALDEIRAEAAACTRCALAGGRTQVVFGAGNPAADLMFVGEAPGYHEDRQGVPFVGAAGGLLTGLLNGIGYEREDVYIANVLKCRPPGNRDPLPEEIEACHPYLLEQIDAIDPVVICTLGNFATRLLLGTQVGISRLRGTRFSYRDRILVPTYHPAAVLHSGRNGTQMAQLEDDFRLVRKLVEEARPRAEARPEGGAGVSDDEQLGLF